MLLAGDDDHEQDARDREVAEAVEERARAQERPAPEKAESLHDLRPQAGGVDLALLLERRPHQHEREERERVGDGVEEERHGTAEREERAAERRPGEHHRRAARPDDAHGRRQLLPRDDGAERSGVRGVEEDGARALDEGDDHDLPERHPVEEDRRGQSSRSRALAPRRPRSSAACGSSDRPRRLPAGRRRPCGTSPAKPTNPAFAGECVTASTSSGYAIAVTCDPSVESSRPVSSSTKSRFRRSGGGGVNARDAAGVPRGRRTPREPCPPRSSRRRRRTAGR